MSKRNRNRTNYDAPLKHPDHPRPRTRRQLLAQGFIFGAGTVVGSSLLTFGGRAHAALSPDHDGPRPFGGVAGTRTGVKCLHAHYAWHLAGGDDPVGRWVADRLAEEAT